MRFRTLSLSVCALALAPAFASAAAFVGSPHQIRASLNPATKAEVPVYGQPNGTGAGVTAGTLINFNNLAEGDTLDNQYAGLGVTFTPDPVIASGTDMTATAVAGGDVGALGTPALVSGMLIHTFSGWLNETGDPNCLATFSVPVGSLSIDFAGNSTASTVPSEIDLYDSSSTLLGFVVANPAGQANPYQQNLSFTSSGNPITFAVIWPGEFNDWVGWDNLMFSTVPEPASMGLLAIGGFVAIRRRR